MKRLICCVLIMVALILSGCSKDNVGSELMQNTDDSSLSSTERNSTGLQTLPQEECYNQNVVLPKITASSKNIAGIFQRVKVSNITIIDAIGDKYYGYRSTYSESGVDDTFVLSNPHTGKLVELNYPDKLDNWEVGSGSTVVLNDRYLYEWKGYTTVSSEEGYDVKLTRIDAESGNVEIVDEIKHSTPLIYLCKINEREFLSYSITQAPSDKTEYAVISSAWIYDDAGEKREIIREKYENDVSWSDSTGILIERFAVKDGNLYGVGRRLISGKYQFFLYHYDKDGTLLGEEVLTGFENIIGSEQILELRIMGDYFVFRTYETLTTYICKNTENGVKLVMKGADGQVRYSMTKNYVFFIESNVNVYSGEIEQKDCPLYVIDVKNDKISAYEFVLPIQTPYFVNIQPLSNGTILITYCDDGAYDPIKMKQFTLNEETYLKFR
mgnify:CR=1 FL=1